MLDKPLNKLTPPLKALLVFDTVAQHLHATQAAKELNVTQSAVSQQLKVLEKHLGFPLLKHQGRQFELTALGKECAQRIHLAFENIRETSLWLQTQTLRNPTITINMPTTFATRFKK